MRKDDDNVPGPVRRWNRRDVLRKSAVLASIAPTVPVARDLVLRGFTHTQAESRNLLGRTFMDPVPVTSVRDPAVRALAHAALNAAESAGAKYADVRVTQSIRGSISADVTPGQSVELGLNVRALVDGYWGWASTPVLSMDEAVRVARRATGFAAQSATRVPGGNVALDMSPPVSSGDWSTPVKIDPFTLDLIELQDWVYGTSRHIDDVRRARGAPVSAAWARSRAGPNTVQFGVVFEKQERLFASTEGTLVTQTVILTTPIVNLNYTSTQILVPHETFNLPIPAGWERISETPLVSLLEQAMDKADATPPPPPVKPIEIGRYDVVFSAQAMAQLMNMTLGPATHLDSAMGREAYAGFVSYLGPNPLHFLGTSIASPLVTITAERSNPLGVATVKWDEEGVAPRDFTLVNRGVLENYQTTRAQAAVLEPWYAKHGWPVQSLGCAMAPSALEEVRQHTPNLTLQPGSGSATEASLIAELEYGLVIPNIPTPPIPNEYLPLGAVAPLGMDWQYTSGSLSGITATEIRHGKPVATINLSDGMALVFRTEELWKNVQALGGKDSLVYAGGFVDPNGSPMQTTSHSVGAVPARVKQLTVIDLTRMG